MNARYEQPQQNPGDREQMSEGLQTLAELPTFTPDECIGIMAVRNAYLNRDVWQDARGIDPRQLEFARWLYLHGRIGEGEPGGDQDTAYVPTTGASAVGSQLRPGGTK